MASIFTSILAGEIPGEIIVNDPLWVALLDIAPANPGHLLLVPRLEATHLRELPPEVLAVLGDYLTRSMQALRAATSCAGINVVLNDGAAAGQAVPHVHFHLIPRHVGDGAVSHPKGRPYASGELARWGQALRSAWR